ncbi:FAD-dependent oxidoreductase [Streptantibioticus rubrisoli]|uniref:NAD(P)/FAD-dependent oxidoreductase n=1 Tax=Streptantibioticus rubrisoli TaxID=1387313 RepID=A0ABT1PAL2_9ACTN|nr:FAD/NAD(P)-binding oxidoreductase [Streptantibioticus rubrisoli]MCQ4042413.1 NAD(P)/FAD-dependent oxidoreductase [Streptantibioticus rubrisoli]
MTQHSKILVIGGGTAGITVAARLRRANAPGVTVLEPSQTHYYQPLWTLVGGGRATLGESARREASVMPRGTRWIKDRATTVDPAAHLVTTADGARLEYDRLVVCPGIQLDWHRVPGMAEAVRTPYASSNYLPELASKTWELIRGLRRGTAVFTMPSGPIKCGGAPQKIAYLAADHWRRQGVLKDIRVVLVLPTPAMFALPAFSEELARVAARYGIEVRLNSELTEVDGDSRKAVIVDNADGSRESIGYDLLHTVPPQSAPDWIKDGPLADPDNPAGYVQVDKYTLRHERHPDVFALGDAGSTPNSKTGAAVRKQAPVVVRNLLATMAGREPTARYDGYASCPITTAQDRMLLAEFDYTMRHTPSIPLIDTTRERRDMWYLKRYGLPFLYWRLMLRGLA